MENWLVWKKRVFFAFLTKIWYPENFTFISEDSQKSEVRGKVKKEVALDVAKNHYVNHFLHFFFIEKIKKNKK